VNTRDVDQARRLAYERSLAPDDAMRRIRDAIGEHDGVFADSDDDESSGPGRITGSCWGAIRGR
jgi:hypothetical protein